MLGVVIVLGGVVSLVAGVTGRRRSRRIRGEGETAWATIVPAPRHPEYEPSAYRPLLRFRTSDGRAVEVFSPLPPTRGRPLVEGQKVLVYFDPAEPTQVLLHWRPGAGGCRLHRAGGRGDRRRCGRHGPGMKAAGTRARRISPGAVLAVEIRDDVTAGESLR